MSKHATKRLPAFACLAVALVALPLSSEAEPAGFNRAIRPILAERCLKCHGPDLQEGGLRLDQPSGATAVLDSGNQAIVPGDASKSVLLERVRSTDPAARMPPTAEGTSLSKEQIALLAKWVAEGATWETHWAYVKPTRPPLPSVKDAGWIANPVDAFILERLEQQGLRPNPEAEKAVLLRRATLDLTGLPPTGKELEAFLADDREDAYERVVDRLLASPQFGVRQAIAWLDLARYADSDGYPHDGERTIWPYRDWVVNAFNADMPYDQFTLEQLAGDRLPAASDSQLVATGFHRNTRINVEAGSDPEIYRLEAVFDRVATTASVWLGSTLACAQCHNHKFDPFTQEDYYRMMAFFNDGDAETTIDEAGRITNVSPKHAFFTREQTQRREALEDSLKNAASEVDRRKLQAELDSIRPVKTLVMRDQPRPRSTAVFLRGDPTSPGKQVTPGVPGFLATANWSVVPDRTSLARWIVDDDNPLTARVAVNRLWMQYFGQGIVATADDFGTQSALASHESLLDWLATELQRAGWRFKPLHRLLVTSATYKQSSAATPEKLEKDPMNRLYSRGSRVRLPAEIVRDNALAIGGILDEKLGGPPTMASSMGANGQLASPYRRSAYVFWKRQQLDETFENFDAPSRDVSCPRRLRTNTPLQALNLLNDRVFVDAARGLARRIILEAPGTFDERLDFALRLCVARGGTEAEKRVLGEFFARRRAAFQSDPESARRLVTEGTVAPPEKADPTELAAWTLVANVLLNLEETITKE